LPLQVFLLLGIGIMLVLQRVTPLPRIWGYLEMYYLFFSAAGLIGIGHLIFNKIEKEQTGELILTSIVFLTTLFIFANITLKTQNRQAHLDRIIPPEQFAADFLAENLTGEDTVVALAPVDIQTAYYLKIKGNSYDIFYQRNHPVKIQNAIVLVRTRTEYGPQTLEDILDFFKLTSSLSLASAQQVFEYGPLFIYSIPAK
jgi:hypothetical protein